MLVGGSALYTRAIVDRFEFPGTDPAVRRRLEPELAEPGGQPRSTGGWPGSTPRPQPGSGPRTAAGSSVPWRSSRSPVGRSPPACPSHEYADPATVQVGVDIDRPTLDVRIEERVRAMFDHGLVDEVERLLAHGLAQGRTAREAIGYRQVLAYLARRAHRSTEAREQTVTATRRFARRQDSWFRKDPRIVWVRWDDPERVAQALQPWRVCALEGGR